MEGEERAWWVHPPYLALMAISIIVTVWVGLRLLSRHRRRHYLPLHSSLMSHCWQTTQFLDKPTYCNSCTQMCFSGSYCVSCGICTCTENCCVKMASSAHTCKPMATPTLDGKTNHFWVKGNLPLSSLCFKCLAPCGNLPKLVDFRCVWCQRTAHEDCVEDVEAGGGPCTLGPHHTSIVPPSSVSLSLEGWRGRRRLVVKGITPPSLVEHWHPLIVMCNPNSGGKDGQTILSTFRKLLNPVQVLDLTEFGPEVGLEICRFLPDHTCRVLACGGDGTVGWILGAIDKADLPRPPHVAILPLGTGNDLARVLGWGKGYEDETVEDILTDVEHSQLSMLDRWQVKVEHKRYLGLHRGGRELTMNNYLGVGCAAGVALNFHRQRESRPQLFPNRIINKAWYAGYGARDIIEQSCKNLQTKIQLYLDDELIKLPELEGVVLLNINSWSAGCTMWSDTDPGDTFGPASTDDQMLEVVGLYSSLHVGRILVSMADPIRLGQARHVKIVLLESVPVQVDGEPWQQRAATITVTHQGQACMLKKTQNQ